MPTVTYYGAPDASLETAVNKSIAEWDWNDPVFGVDELVVGKLASIKDGYLHNGYSLRIRADAKSFPPKGVRGSSLNRVTSLYHFRSESDSEATRVPKFPKSIDLRRMLSAECNSGENGFGKVFQDPDASVSLAKLVLTDHNRVSNQPFACLAIQSGSGIASLYLDENDERSIPREDALSGGNPELLDVRKIHRVFQRDGQHTTEAHDTVALRLAELIWGVDDHGSRRASPVKYISNSSGLVHLSSGTASRSSSSSSNRTFTLCVGTVDGSQCLAGVVVKNDKPGGQWYALVGHNEVNTFNSWGSQKFYNTIPGSFGFEERTNGDFMDEKRTYKGDGSVVRSKLTEEDLRKVALVSGANEKGFSDLMRFTSPPDALELMHCLGFPKSGDVGVITIIAQVLSVGDPDKMNIKEITAFFPAGVMLDVDGPWTRLVLAAASKGKYPDQESGDQLKAILPGLANGKLPVPTALLRKLYKT